MNETAALPELDFDPYASVILRGNLGTVLPALVEQL